MQGVLLDLEAQRRGLTPDAVGVEARLQQYLQDVKSIPAAREILQRQAESVGLDWQSEEFAKTYLIPAMEKVIRGECLNQQILAQVGDDQFGYALRDLCIDLLNRAVTRIDYEQLAEGAKNLHIPAADELPWVKQPVPPIPEP